MISVGRVSELHDGRRKRNGQDRGAAAAPDPEVSAKATRRRFSPRYKLSVVERADAGETPGEIGKLLRSEGLYSSHLSAWRKAVREGSLEALARRRGPKPSVDRGTAKKMARLEREVARLREELRKAHLVIEVQGKYRGCWA